MNNSSKTGLLILVALLIVSFLIGGYILTSTFFGFITLAGLIVMIESIPPLKWLVQRSSRIVDICIFAFTIFATMSYGLNIAASLTVAGLGYTLYYAPRLREDKAHQKSIRKPMPDGRDRHDWR